MDFLSADSHKWLLGPAGAGIVYVSREKFDLLEPALLGSWNVVSPQFVAQESIDFYEGARRYEPGMLNLPGIVGMAASLEMLLSLGIEAISERILELRPLFVNNCAHWNNRQYIEEHDRSPHAAEPNARHHHGVPSRKRHARSRAPPACRLNRRFPPPQPCRRCLLALLAPLLQHRGRTRPCPRGAEPLLRAANAACLCSIRVHEYL